MKKYVIWRKVTLFWDIWEVKISLSDWSNWIWSHSSSLTYYWLIPRLQSHLSLSGNVKEVLLWTVSVSSITFHVSEGSSIGWYTSWPLLTNINTKNCSLSIVLTATDQQPQKSLKRWYYPPSHCLNVNVMPSNMTFLMIFAVFDPSPLKLWINCSF